MSKKQRLDVLLVEKKLAETREKAKGFIMAGIVYVNNQKVDKPGTNIESNTLIEVRGNTNKYVSRGGLKLEKALQQFNINIKDKVAMDIGASTGGFTDCMLQNGAKKVYAIDVGYGQLAWKLRQDNRVIVMEKTNIRYVKPEQIVEQVDFVSIDVSFISLKLVIPVALKLLKDEGSIVCLIKPQFEAGREKVGKKGVVRDKKVHFDVINNIIKFSKDIGLYADNLDFSPIKGPEGNIEYLLHLKQLKFVETDNNITENLINEIVMKSHNDL